jgi:hypothetical protein
LWTALEKDLMIPKSRPIRLSVISLMNPSVHVEECKTMILICAMTSVWSRKVLMIVDGYSVSSEVRQISVKLLGSKEMFVAFGQLWTAL